MSIRFNRDGTSWDSCYVFVGFSESKCDAQLALEQLGVKHGIKDADLRAEENPCVTFDS